MIVVLLPLGSRALAEGWPAWRGPAGNAVAPAGDYPVEFGPEENCTWSIDLGGEGSGTPIVWGEAVFVCATVDGQDTITCYNLADGSQRWQQKLGDSSQPKHRAATGSNPSPVTDGKHVVGYFKSGLVVCCDMDGNHLWQKNLQREYGEDTLWWDLGTSPILTSAGVMIAVMQEGDSYLVTLDLDSGNVVWKQRRQYDTARESDQSYTTPAVQMIDGVETIVTWGADHLTGHDAKTGKQLWECGGFNVRREGMWRTIASATVAEGVAYVPFGRGSHLAAIQLGGEGDITGQSKLWQENGSGVAADVPSPIVSDGKVYVLGDKGELSCRDAQTGEVVWSGRLPRGRAPYYSSPLLAGDKLYCVREDGTIFVCQLGGDNFKVIAENDVDHQIVATPVPVADSLLVRTRTHLFRFSKSK